MRSELVASKESIRLSKSDSVKELDFSGQTKLRTIAGEFPEGLEVLKLVDCESLISAPLVIPKSLKLLDLTGLRDYELRKFWPEGYLQQLQVDNPDLKIIGARL